MRSDIAQTVGKPYIPGGRGPDGYDCWGLAMFVVEKITGQKIPDYGLDPNEQKLNACFAGETIIGEWTKIKTLTPGLIVAFQLFEPGKITHVGVTIGDGKLIQCLDKRGVTVESIRRYQNIIEGFYKYKGDR